MIVATRGGDGWLWYAFGLILLLCGGERRFAALEAGGLSAAAGIALFRALKRTSRRKRPCEIEPHCWASILPPDKYSFPSGHAITAFAVAVSVGFFYPYLEISLLGAAFLIAASRIILGMHFLSDVIAGSAIGIGLGFASFHILAII
jgi:undecaprenyl-diphosphatase